ncbi:hypothetical protein [Halalkalicoccus jeotgali]|uniref:Uncharacterized protein n=1 Tax=Halalkalicoccus jeotgali (strain DSM 18796 / CECT 7217 / JCM 14584 / KCTC 4019 / B3) TaxID=795797 RepID=D8J6N4_HALJB|nr:hypothetical protein [Halalkalicoccus jeotgali]ADJ13911.1 hypothetical protein HacjB3_02590 [Halalkalicoccus jeotgali B3]ELY34044.1 hypothetical protein C497_16732 [Halalkalicoccus jeotgali B3]
MATKRQLERKLAELEAQNHSTTPEEDDRECLELHFDGLHAYELEPELTDTLSSYGFVVERDVREYANGRTVVLQTTPSASAVLGAVSWHRDGPTADHNDVRIIWEPDRLEQVRADAEHSTVYVAPDVPDETERTVIAEGDGWTAIVPSDRVITNRVVRRKNAEYHGYEILGPVELPLENAAEYDLVEVTTDPDGDRQSRDGDD